MSKRIAVIPDLQVRPGVPTEHITHIGMYLAEKKPDIIVNIGDFADMPSLSSHDKAGSKSMEGQRYKADIKSVHDAMTLLMNPIREEQNRQRRNKDKIWRPELVFTLGNHENRIDRAINNDPKLDGLISLKDLKYEEFGWYVYPFLEPVVREGVSFCHYFCSGVMGRPITTARAMLSKMHMSCFAGHQQGRDIATGVRADGKEITAIICGSAYAHDENYLNYQTNNHFRGIYILNDVYDGSFEECPVTLRYLTRRYGPSPTLP
jgi:hypothetical protein